MTNLSWIGNRTKLWFRKNFDYILMVLVILIAAFSVASLGRCNIEHQEGEFKGVRFDGIHRGADYTLVTFTRNGSIEGRSFASYDDAVAFAEALR